MPLATFAHLIDHTIDKLTAILGSETVDGVISFSFLAHKSTEGVGRERVGGTSFVVNIGNIELDAGMIFGSDQTVSGGTNNSDIRENTVIRMFPIINTIPSLVNTYHLRGM